MGEMRRRNADADELKELQDAVQTLKRRSVEHIEEEEGEIKILKTRALALEAAMGGRPLEDDAWAQLIIDHDVPEVAAFLKSADEKMTWEVGKRVPGIANARASAAKLG